MPPLRALRQAVLGLAATVLLGLGLAAQGPGQLPYRVFGNRQGLMSSAINAIHQDGQGLLWVATELGLHRYDGRAFQALALPLPDTQVLSLGSENRRLWVGTRKGLFLLGAEGPLPLPSGLPGPGRPVTHLQTDPSGAVWFLLGGAPWRGSAESVAPAGSLPEGAPATGLFVDPNGGAAFLCGPTRLWTYDGGLWRGLPGPKLRKDETIQALALDGGGDLWLRTTLGAWRRGASWVFRPLVPAGGYPVVQGLGRCRDGSIWLAAGEDLYRVAGPAWERVAHPAFGPMGVASLDREGSLWVGAGNLFQVVGQGRWRHWDHADGLPSPLTWQVRQDAGGRLWAASDGGLVLGTGQGWRTLVRGRFLRLTATQDGTLWAMRTDTGTIYRMDPGTEAPVPLPRPQGIPSGILLESLAASGPNLWLLADDRLWLGTPVDGHLLWQPQAHPALGRLRMVLEDGRGGLFLSGEEGLMALEGGAWVKVQGLPTHSVLSLARAGNGTLALAYGELQELTLLGREGGAWKVQRTLDPLPKGEQRIVYALAFDRRDRLWLGTNQGLLRVQPGSPDPPLFYEEGEGLFGSDVSHQSLLFDPQGRLWVCTATAINRYEVEAEDPEPPLPAPVLLYASEGTLPLPLEGPWTLRAGDRLRASFVVPTYLHPESLRFVALLDDGNRTSTLELTQPLLDLPSLGSRTYRVTLLGRLKEGFNSPGTTLKVTVRPPPWATPWAIASYLAALILAGALLSIGRQNQLRRRAEGLELQVAQRTEELVLASQAKSHFLANMSHELRTPLNAILLYSELLQDEARESGHKDKVEDAGKIFSAGRHLLSLIDNILDLSKIEAGRMSLELEEVEVASFLADLEAALRPLVEKPGNRFLLNHDPSLRRFRTDPVRLRQILSNLLANAGKFTANGHVELSARTEGQEAVFVVRDTGIGMDRVQAQRVFDPFVQADASTTRRYGGTGLGLALVRRLSIFLGGSVDLRTAPGEGSTFTLRLPLVHPSDTQNPVEPKP